MSQRMNKKLALHLRKVIQTKDKYPFGVLAYFGPDNKQITKAVAVIISNPGLLPNHRSWDVPGPKITSDTAHQIGQYFLNNQVLDVVMTEGILGCPHEEGVDFPLGGQCNECEYWLTHSE